MNEMKRKSSINRFQELREKELDKYGKPISKIELAKRLSKYCYGINRQKIQNIENGEKRIDADIFKAYMQYFHVSADYLLGFSDRKKGFDADVISCADYLGVDRLTISHIHEMTRGKVSLKYNENSEFYTDDYIDRLNYVAEMSGFSFDCLMSSFDRYDREAHCFSLFYCLYEMIRAYIRHYDNIKAWKETGVYNPDIYSYKGISLELINYIFRFIETLDFEKIKSRALEYDAKNDSDIYSDLFGD